MTVSLSYRIANCTFREIVLWPVCSIHLCSQYIELFHILFAVSRIQELCDGVQASIDNSAYTYSSGGSWYWVQVGGERGKPTNSLLHKCG